MLVAILVVNHHQPLDQAWRCTLREWFLITDFKAETRRRRGRTGYDRDRLLDLEAHIRSLGVET